MPWAQLLRRLLGAGALASGLISVWLLAQSPFAAPWVERNADEAKRALDRAIARQVTPDWLLPRVDAALAEDDLLALESYLSLAEDHGVALPDDRRRDIELLQARRESLLGQAGACGSCAWDITTCDSFQRLGLCALPVEITPIGDLNALRRNGAALASGAEVDGIEVGLATLGLGASAAVVATWGGAGPVKLGVTALRLSRRLGTLTPEFTRVLKASLPPRRALVRGEGLGPLRAVAADLGTVSRNTTPADTLLLLRQVDTAEDAARLARLSTIAGPETRPALLALGKTRAFRTLVRLSDMARATLAALVALVAQLAGLALSLVLRSLRRQIAATESRRLSCRQGE
ncbi:hypothetical protein [Tropicimonas aquimaris]|uniref:Uncharacterized protein n=1 Tax=Tropicimonas aquimaris TaxID=914152 RepID=A0ABW3ILZ7_9RHOB